MDPGTEFGRYRVRRLLGKGAMGEVYLAHDPELGRDVALKVLPPELAGDEERLARLRREARALASLSHANVAAVYGFEEHTGTRVIVMEAVDGEPLADKLEHGRLPVPRTHELAAQLARALEAAHEAGIVHRDLKPGNVMITSRGEVKVLDFGLAKPLAPRSGRTDSELLTVTVEATRAGSVMGTAPYMSPEQARGDAVDERTDIWAFGCVVYEMLTGQRAFHRETLADTLAAVIEVEPDWARLPDDTPDAVRRLLQRTLAKSSDRRLRHIGDARLELEEAAGRGAAGSTDAAGRVASPAATMPARAGLSKGIAAVIAVAAIAVALAAGWSMFGNDGNGDVITDRSIAVLPFETLGQDEATSFTDGIHGDMLTRLSKLSGLSVISRTSVMQYRDPQESLPEIARALGVTWVLMGEVQEAGGQVQVNARLVHGPEDRQVWAESYRRELSAENLFQIQSELTGEIAAQLQAQLTPAELRAMERMPTNDLDAYRLYVRGRGYLDQRTEDEMRRAFDYFHRAIEQDPDYALAWAGIADTLSLLRWYGHDLPTDAPAPEQAALRALELAPDLAEAHASHGIYLSSSLVADAPGALRALQRAVELRPSYAEAHIWVAWVQLLLGEPEEGLRSAELAAELDPLSPVNRVFLADSYLANGAPRESFEAARRATEIQSEFALAHFMAGIALFHLERYDEATSALQTAQSLVSAEDQAPSLAQITGLLGLVAVVSGDPSTGRERLAEVEASGDPFSLGLLHAALGDRDAAFAAFERVPWTSLSMSVEGFRYFFPDILGPLRQDPRYEDVLEAIDRSLGVRRDVAGNMSSSVEGAAIC